MLLQIYKYFTTGWNTSDERFEESFEFGRETVIVYFLFFLFVLLDSNGEVRSHKMCVEDKMCHIVKTTYQSEEQVMT